MRSNNFVEPYREPGARIVEIESVRELPAPPQTVLLPTANYTDRAKGFSLATGPLAAATGFVVLLIGISAFGVPVLSVAALLLALAGFTVAWLIAYVAHTIVSPDGVLFLHTVLAWRYLDRGQKEQHRRYASIHERNYKK